MLQVDSFGYEKHERFSMAETDVVTLAIKVKAEDAKKQLDAFEKRLKRLQGATVPVRVKGAERAQRSLNQINGTLGGLSRFAKGATAALAGIFTVSAVTKGAYNAVKAFSDMQEETQKFGIVFSGVSKEAEAGVPDLQWSAEWRAA